MAGSKPGTSAKGSPFLRWFQEPAAVGKTTLDAICTNAPTSEPDNEKFPQSMLDPEGKGIREEPEIALQFFCSCSSITQSIAVKKGCFSRDVPGSMSFTSSEGASTQYVPQLLLPNPYLYWPVLLLTRT